MHIYYRQLIQPLVCALSAVGFLGAAALPACASQESTSLLTRSNRHENAQDYAEAINLRRQALKADPSDSNARQFLAQSYRAYALSLESQKQLPKAFRQLHLALYLFPNSSESRVQLDHLFRSAKLDPADYQAHLRLASESFEAGKFIDAVVERRVALSLHDDEAVRIALNQAIPSRTDDPDYMPEFDMRQLPPAVNTDDLIATANDVIRYQYIWAAQTLVDNAVAQAPDDPRVKQLQKDLEAARSKRAEFYLQQAQKFDQANDKSSALANYAAVRALHLDDETTVARIDELKKSAQPSITKEYADYALSVQSHIKKNWAVFNRKLPGGNSTVLFRIQKDGSISDIVLSQKSGSEQLDEFTINAIGKTVLPAPPPGGLIPIDFQMTFNRNVFNNYGNTWRAF